MSTSRRPGPSVRLRITEVKGAMRTQHEDRVVTEEPLEIRLAEPLLPPGRVSVTMRTPGHDFELAAGWLFHEGVVASVDDLSSVAYCTDVALTPEQELNVVTATLRVPHQPPDSKVRTEWSSSSRESIGPFRSSSRRTWRL